MTTTVEEIAAGNLIFIRTLFSTPKHKIVLSEFVGDMKEATPELFEQLITKLRIFNDWTKDNDPYGERDFGRIKVDGQEFFFKIDLYDPSWEYGFDRETMPAAQCHRLLTLMQVSEY